MPAEMCPETVLHQPTIECRWDILDVVAGVAVRDSSILMLKRNTNDVEDWSETWCFAGGKVEAGETLEEALIREWKEELGGVITVGPLLHARIARTKGFDRPYRVHTFLVHPLGESKLVSGGTDISWVPVALVSSMNLIAGTMESIHALMALTGRSLDG